MSERERERERREREREVNVSFTNNTGGGCTLQFTDTTMF